jgi:hypothetical protein
MKVNDLGLKVFKEEFDMNKRSCPYCKHDLVDITEFPCARCVLFPDIHPYWEPETEENDSLIPEPETLP